MRSAFVGSDSSVSIVKIVSLSLPCRKTKVKKLINVSYLDNGESSLFRISLHLYILQYMSEQDLALNNHQRLICRTQDLAVNSNKGGLIYQ